MPKVGCAENSKARRGGALQNLRCEGRCSAWHVQVPQEEILVVAHTHFGVFDFQQIYIFIYKDKMKFID